jgi:hypothetical protein
MKKVQKVIKCIFRYEMGFSLKNSGFSYLYGSISYLFGYENFGCFFLMAPALGCSADVFNVKTRHGRLRCALLCAAAPSAAFGTPAAASSTVDHWRSMYWGY